MTNTALSDPLVVGIGYSGSPKAECNVKEPNYTDAMEATMREVYEADPTPETVVQLMETMDKSKRSVIAKLSSMKVYVTPARTTKAGGKIVKKSELVDMISNMLEVSMPSLEKANKKDLEALAAAVEEWTGPPYHT